MLRVSGSSTAVLMQTIVHAAWVEFDVLARSHVVLARKHVTLHAARMQYSGTSEQLCDAYHSSPSLTPGRIGMQ